MRLAFVGLLFVTGSLRSEETTVSFDFGTAAGKTTALAAGFSQSMTGSGAFADLPDGLEVRVNPDSAFQNFAFLRSFEGLGGGQAKDFTISTEIRVNNLAGGSHENNDRWGILVLGSPGSDTADTNGIAAQVLAKANTTTGVSQTAQLVLREGVNGTILSSANWVGGPIVQGDALRLRVVGTYLNATQLSLEFTLSRLDGSQSQSITTTVTGAKLNGTLFGGALRIKNGRAIEYDNFSVAADFPEQPLPPVPVNLVVDGPDGLVYSPYANQGQTNAVHTVPDFSRAGYKGGGVSIPFVPAAITLNPEPGDDRERIQNAINSVASMPMGPNGFRGAILLRAGDYHVSSSLLISASGIVIRGEGSHASGGTRIIYTATTQSNLFNFQGSSNPSVVSGTSRTVTSAIVPVGARTLLVENALPFSPGDMVRITNTVNQQWIDDIRMDQVSPPWTPGEFQLATTRYVTAVNGNQLTLDAPIMQAIESQYGGAKVERLTFTEAIRNVGIEAIRLESTYTSNTDENHGWSAVVMRGVVDGWVRQVTVRHFGYAAVDIQNFSQFITVEDSAMLDPISQTTGGRKYSFNVNDSSYVLMQRNLTRGGRHDFVTGSRTPGPNAFIDGLATQASNDIGPHFRYATGQIYDNIKSNHTIRVQNRFNSGTSHGWSGAQVMFWNVESPGVVSTTPTGAMNWSVGTVGARQNGAWVPSDPHGIWESHNVHVQPRSLFYAQLRDRLGAAALKRVQLPQQTTAPIWNDLLAWNGNGLFGPALITSIDTDAEAAPGIPLPLRGIVRNLRILDHLTAVSWTVVSGPGHATISDPSALETDVEFSAAGSYLLELSASGAGVNAVGRILVPVRVPGAGATPSAPLALAATFQNGQAQLQWQGSPEPSVVGYNIYRSLVPNAQEPPIFTAHPSTTFNDGGVVSGLGYYYAVSAVDSDGNESPRSVEVFLSTIQPIIRPATPQGFAAFFDGGNVQLSWNVHADPQVVGFNLYRSPVANTPGAPFLTGLSGTSHVDATVLLGASYFYSITAVNSEGVESIRSPEILTVALSESDEVQLNIPAIDSAYTRAGAGILDSSQWLGVKRADFTGTARAAFLRFPLSSPGLLGGLDPDNIENISLAIFITQNQPGDTVRLYGLLNGAQASGTHLSETTWTGGMNGTAAGGKNLQASNRPDGGGGLPNAFTTVELGSITFPGASTDPINNALGLQTIQVSNLEAFRQLLRNDTNGQITLLLRGQLDREFNQIASTFNTNGHLVPTLALTVSNGDDFEDLNGNGIADEWELANLGRLLGENEIMHESGTPFYFLYLHGTDLANSSERRFRVTAEPTEGRAGLLFAWEVLPQFVLGTDYDIRISTDLTRWDPIPSEHYTLEITPVSGRTRIELTLTHDYGGRVFFRLIKP